MAKHDPYEGLRDLTQQVQDSAQPPPLSRIRTLGNRRRRRRQVAVGAGAIAAAVLAAGVVVTGAGIFPTGPPIAQRPEPMITANPQRVVSEANLLTSAEITPSENSVVEQADPDAGRSPDEASVCQPDGLAPLGAVNTVSRNFIQRFQYGPGESPDPDFPMTGQPSIYTTALQFADDAAAQQAYTTYTGWVNDCEQRLEAADYRVGEPGVVPRTWTPVDTTAGEAEFAEITYQLPDETNENGGYFETMGLGVVDDRLVIAVYLSYGQDFNVSMDPEGDDETGLPPHPMFAILAAATERLTQ